MFDRLRERLFPPTPEPVFTDPTLGPLAWHPLRETWSAELGSGDARYRFEIARRKPSPVPPEAVLLVVREMIGRLSRIRRAARRQMEEEAAKSDPARAAEIRGLAIHAFHLSVDDNGVVQGYVSLAGPVPNPGWHFTLLDGMPVRLDTDTSPS